MVQFVPLLDAKKLADKNRRKYEKLEHKRSKAEGVARVAQENLDEAYTETFESYLVPFAETFARLKNVDLGSLPTVEAVPELKSIDVELQEVSVNAVEGLTALAGGTAAGAAAGGVTFAAVGALATASTGTAIAGLGGAAATSATLAWLGGGSLAAGGMGVAGGTAVLTGIVAAPALVAVGGFLWWKGKKAYRDQVRLREKLRQAKAELDPQLVKASLATARVFDTARVVRKLVKVGGPRLTEFDSLVDANDDYATYSTAQKGLVAELAGLATAMAAVIACPVLDDGGNVTMLSDETLEAAKSAAERLAA